MNHVEGTTREISVMNIFDACSHFSLRYASDNGVI